MLVEFPVRFLLACMGLVVLLWLQNSTEQKPLLSQICLPPPLPLGVLRLMGRAGDPGLAGDTPGTELVINPSQGLLMAG